MDDLFDTFKYIARRFHGRWGKLDDALARIQAFDGNRNHRDGERARRIFENAFGKQAYVSATRKSLIIDRANALDALHKPLIAALGHIVTIELVDKMLAELDAAEKARWHDASIAEEAEQKGHYGPLIQALHWEGVNRGAYSALNGAELSAIAKYIMRKAAQRVKRLPELRKGAQTHGEKGRLHMFWNPFRLKLK